MTARADRDGEAGFLLAEMLTTLTISAFVLMGLVALGSLLLRAVDRSVAAVERTDELGRTLSSLDTLIGSAIRARFDGAPGQPFLFNGDDRRLMIAHRDTTPGAPPVTRVVALRSDNGRLLRAEAALPARVSGLEELQFGEPRVIYAGGARIRFTYAAPPSATETSHETTTSWPVGTAMPAAVTVEAFDSASGRVLMHARATIAANGDLGCTVDGACGRGDAQPADDASKSHPKTGDPAHVAGAGP